MLKTQRHICKDVLKSQPSNILNALILKPMFRRLWSNPDLNQNKVELQPLLGISYLTGFKNPINGRSDMSHILNARVKNKAQLVEKTYKLHCHFYFYLTCNKNKKALSNRISTHCWLRDKISGFRLNFPLFWRDYKISFIFIWYYWVNRTVSFK